MMQSEKAKFNFYYGQEKGYRLEIQLCNHGHHAVELTLATILLTMKPTAQIL